MDWNEHNDHADGADYPEPDDCPDVDHVAAPMALPSTRGTWLYAVPSEPQGAYCVALASGWERGPLRPVVHSVPVNEEDVYSGWATRLCWLDDARTATVEPEPPR